MASPSRKDAIKIVRPAWNQDDFDRLYGYSGPKKAPFLSDFQLSNLITFNRQCLFKSLSRFVPISHWLLRYKSAYLLSDLIAGLTIGIMIVPQGMAYAQLAGLDPVFGLYSCFFPSLLYMLFGTSRHVSLGVFAVTSLMVGNVRLRILPDFPPTMGVINGTRLLTDVQVTPINIVTALSFAVGLVQLMMAILKVSFLTSYLSDQVVGGFTTGVACHVLASQVDKLIGVSVNRHSGLFKLFYKFHELLLALPNTNLVTLLISIVCLLFLVLAKEMIGPWFHRRISVPLPFDLVAVIVATVLSHIFSFSSKFNVAIIERIPTGTARCAPCTFASSATSTKPSSSSSNLSFPRPTLPCVDLLPTVLADAVGISIVIFVVTVSVGKLFAKKHGYRINPAQELRALGFINCLISTFSCIPASASLTRSAVNSQIGVRTQLSCLFSGSLLLMVILFISPLLEPLPMCVLACIVVLALKGMFMQLNELKELWPVSKIDFMIWLVSFISTACWDVTQGLAISVAFALMTVIFRSQWPKSVELARLPNTDLYRDQACYSLFESTPFIRVLRFDSPLLFTNVDVFKKRAHQLANIDDDNVQDEESAGDRSLKALIIDGSGFTYIDHKGVNALKEISHEMLDRGVDVHFAYCKAPVRELFQLAGLYEIVPKTHFYPTVHDAMVFALSSIGNNRNNGETNLKNPLKTQISVI